MHGLFVVTPPPQLSTASGEGREDEQILGSPLFIEAMSNAILE